MKRSDGKRKANTSLLPDHQNLVTTPNPSLPRPQIEWDKAAADYGSASVESYKKGVQNTIKKIKKAMDDGVQPAEGSSSTPAKAANKGGRKRKEKTASAVVESEGEEAVVEEEAPPKKKAKAKAAPKKSKAALKKEAEAAAAAAEAEDDEVVKSEVDDAE